MKTRFMRIVASTLALATIMTVTAGCSGNSASSGSTGGAAASAAGSSSAASTGGAKSDVTLNLLWPSSNAVAGINAEVAAFEKKTGIKTNIELTATGSELDNIVKSRIATNDLPDILGYNCGSLLSPLNPENNFLDLTNESFMQNVDDDFKKAVTVNGKQYGIPSQEMSVGCVVYNKKIYKELNLTVPKTWKEFIANCDKIKAAGKTAILGSNKDSWTSQVLILGDYYNIEKANPTFADDYTANKAHYADTPAALRGFEKLAQLKSGGYLNKDYMSVSYSDGEKLITEGSAAHWFILSQCLGDISTKYPDKVNDLDVFPIPSDDAKINGFTVWEPTAFYFSKSSDKIDAMKQWAAFMVSDEALQAYSGAEKLFGPYALKNAKLPDDVIPAVKTLQSYIIAGNGTAALEFKSPVKGPNLMNICVECMSGQKSAADCAKEYDNDVKQQAKQLNLKGW
ncbi:MAG TPA: extracellular solute-binding protein [Clostridiales bacterium]|nr:extracellular solute-binding protein [Clostridiales bacterium]